MAIRSARRHKLFALICFLFFIVVRLWVLAILERDWFLMSFCFLCTVFTVKAWRKERSRGDVELSNALGEIMRSLEGGVGGRGGGEEKGNWKRFKFSQQRPPRPPPLPPSRAHHTQAQANLDEQNTCSICICEYEPSDTCVQLPCGHIYHDECLEQWIENHHKCPLCNMDLRAEEVRVREEQRSVRREEERRQREEQHNRMQQSGIMVFS
ncbi:hypothetical protein TL16_g05694 [Triparma laevis f. inornata]|uniref:RING-type domain-containing protein n=1 Tax=Triparma laevis f. inornata TaxID=1714386 RepID=A0A9W7E7T9_9STRA|nr:hypothetical protein TL16_g05694 [Triparma laevis f. inornata]